MLEKEGAAERLRSDSESLHVEIVAGASSQWPLALALGGPAEVRSKAIARTETTMAFNAGHQASYEAMADDGAVSGKTWLAIINNVARDMHVEANEQTVPVKADFTVGGSKAAYPGDWRLPAEERVNCRCTTVSELAE